MQGITTALWMDVWIRQSNLKYIVDDIYMYMHNIMEAKVNISKKQSI